MWDMDSIGFLRNLQTEQIMEVRNFCLPVPGNPSAEVREHVSTMTERNGKKW